MIQVRKIQQTDIEQLYGSLEALKLPKQALSNKLEDIMLVFDRNELCGVGCGINTDDKCLLNWIHICESFRRGRLGTALAKNIMNNAELNGAQEAYISGTCDEFAASLRFEKLTDKKELQEVEKLYEIHFGEAYEHNFYKVSLKDYFKPCCCGKS